VSFNRVTGRGVPEWLHTRALKGSQDYWIRYRKGGINLIINLSKIEGVDGQRAAIDKGQDLLSEAIGRKTSGRPISTIRLEAVCDDVVSLKRSKSPRTYARNESISRVHVKPYLRVFCPYAKEFNATTWDHYFAHKRAENPTVTLFGHWKFFVSISTYMRKKGLIREAIKFDYKEGRDDFRKSGQVIHDAHLRLMLEHSTGIWRERILIQRFTGMRPGEVSNLRKDRVDLATGKIALRKEDTKTRRKREFLVVSEVVLEILRRRAQTPDTPFFFPGRDDPSKPIDASLKYWKRAIEKANIELRKADKKAMPADYTPHDLRHTFLTTEFKKPGAAHASICYMAGLTLDEAQKTYLHFNAEDTRSIAERLAKDSQELTKDL
jgi:integrase